MNILRGTSIGQLFGSKPVRRSRPKPRFQKVLVVDDDAVMRMVLAMYLEREGYTVVTASNPADAMTASRNEWPDLILMDVCLPQEAFATIDWDGFGLIEWVRQNETDQRTPIIVMTGGDIEKSKARAKAVRAAGFYQKPFDPAELLVQLEVILKGPVEHVKSGGPASFHL